MQSVHTLIIDTLGRVGVGTDQGRNDGCRRLASAGGMKRQKSPHDFLIILFSAVFIVFIVSNHPGRSLLGILLAKVNRPTPVLIRDGFVESRQVLVIVDLQGGGCAVQVSHDKIDPLQQTLIL
jgi:hypothetical protein